MSMSQFKKWLKSRGVTQGPRCYHIPCKTLSLDVRDAEYRLRVTITTNTRDRHGDILEPGGAMVASYLKNPVVLWAHEYRSLPIGRATSLVRDGQSLKAEILFAPTDFAREVCDLYAKGFLYAWSVGFLPLEWEVIEDEEGKFTGYHIKSWELIEFSAVPVPANPDALGNAMRKGLVHEPTLVKALAAVVSGQSKDQTASLPSEVKVASVPRHSGRVGQPDGVVPPEISLPDLAGELASKLILKLRPVLGEAVLREIRRQQGRLV